MTQRAFVRSVPKTFDRAIVVGAAETIDVPLARRQHDGYVAALASAGYTVNRVPADDALPDCPFIEDTAVVLDGSALSTLPGAESRRAEPEAVALALGEFFEVTEMEPPGTLDGGDVLRMGRKLYVGRSARTNSAGIKQLTAFAAQHGWETIPTPVRNVLHLKSAILALGPETLLRIGNQEDIEADDFADYEIVATHPTEVRNTSALAVGDGRVLVTASSPLTAESIAAVGFDVTLLDVSEFQTADGGLTCLSILTPLPH